MKIKIQVVETPQRAERATQRVSRGPMAQKESLEYCSRTAIFHAQNFRYKKIRY
jgi:hypothetical protein